jgi:Superinfection immunity protein
MEVLRILLIIAIALVVYFTPSYLGRDKRKADAIFTLNLFWGWTIIGWLAALAWSLFPERTRHVSISK